MCRLINIYSSIYVYAYPPGNVCVPCDHRRLRKPEGTSCLTWVLQTKPAPLHEQWALSTSEPSLQLPCCFHNLLNALNSCTNHPKIHHKKQSRLHLLLLKGCRFKFICLSDSAWMNKKSSYSKSLFPSDTSFCKCGTLSLKSVPGDCAMPPLQARPRHMAQGLEVLPTPCSVRATTSSRSETEQTPIRGHKRKPSLLVNHLFGQDKTVST